VSITFTDMETVTAHGDSEDLWTTRI